MPFPSSVDTGQVTPWYLANPNALAALNAGGGVLTANTTYIHDVYAPCPMILTGWNIRHSGVSAGHFDVGIYDSSGNLLDHSGVTVCGSAAATQNVSPSNGNLWIAQGRYYFALWVDNSTDTYLQLFLDTNSTALVDAYLGATTNTGGLKTSFTAMGGTTRSNAVFVPFIGLIQGTGFNSNA